MKRILGIVVFLLAAFALAGCQLGENEDNLPQAYDQWTVNGGDGLTGDGGSGGLIQVLAAEGPISVRGGGPVDVDFSMPERTEPFLGYNPFVVSRNSELQVYLDETDADANAADGEYLLLLDSSTVWQRETAGNYVEASGMRVAEGVTLVVGLNIDANTNLAHDTGSIQFSNDVVIRGTVRSATLDTGNLAGTSVEPVDGAPALDRDRGSLAITANNVYSTGELDASGIDATVDGDRGGFGGSINVMGISAVAAGGYITGSGGYGAGSGKGGDAGASSSIVGNFEYLDLDGRINMSGGRGASGGNGGNLDLISMGAFHNTAEVSVNGDVGENGNGGDAGDLTVVSYFQTGRNDGTLYAEGGHAIDHGAGPLAAGNGGDIVIVSYVGFYNTGAVEADGGILLGDGVAGNGGSIILTQSVNNILAGYGRFSAHGGPAYGGAGGNGGSLQFQTPGRAILFGTADLRGGGGDIGGTGGQINIQAAAVESAVTGHFSADGGAGANGGNAGDISLNSVAGNVGVNRSLSARGGRGIDGNGGVGGMISVYAFGRSRAEGMLSVRGGDGAATGVGGPGGVIDLQSGNGYSIHGEYNARGGQAGTDGANGTVSIDGTVVFP